MGLVITLETFENLTMAVDEENIFAGDYPFDLSAERQLIFIYVNTIEYQYVGDTKAPHNRVIWFKTTPEKW